MQLDSEKPTLDELFTGLSVFREIHAVLPDNQSVVLKTLSQAAGRRLTQFDIVGLSQLLYSRILGAPEREKRALHELLSLALGGLAPHCHEPRPESREAAAFCCITLTAAMLYPTGLIRTGDLPYLSASSLELLASQCRQSRASAVRRNRAKVAPVGELFEKFVFGSDFKELIGQQLEGTVRPRAASFIHYGAHGDGVCPHLDEPTFRINCIICLCHDTDGSSKASFAYWSADGQRHEVDLSPGRVVLFHASGTAHGLTDLSAGEQLSLAVVGLSD